MQDLNDLYYFVHVVDHGGFAPAGRVIGESKSKLSRRLAKLEERLGMQLVQRSTRHFSVTEIGQTYYVHCKAMLVEAEAAQEAIELTRAEPCGIVRITCPVTLLSAHVSMMLSAFMLQYPRVDVHLEATDRRVDLVSEAVDIALRVRPLPLEDSELVMRVLGESRQCLVASPDLLNRVGAPKAPADLTRLPSLGAGKPHQEFEWKLLGPNGAQTSVKHRPRFVTRDMIALRYAALAGVGVVQLPEIIVRDELARNALARPVPDWAPLSGTIHAVFVSRRRLLPSVRAVIDFLTKKFEVLDDY